MADTHYEVDESLKPARDLMEAMRSLAAAWDRLSRVRGVLIQTRTGDGSADTDYATIVTRYGYSSNAEARASFEEIDGNWATVDAKIQQMLNRHL